MAYNDEGYAYLFYDGVYSTSNHSSSSTWQFYIKDNPNSTVAVPTQNAYDPEAAYAWYEHKVQKLKDNATKPPTGTPEEYNSFYTSKWGITSGEKEYLKYNSHDWAVWESTEQQPDSPGTAKSSDTRITYTENTTQTFTWPTNAFYVYVKCLDHLSGEYWAATGNYRNAYWSTKEDVELPVQPLTGYTQGDYTCGSESKAPGSSYNTGNIYTSKTWVLNYTANKYKVQFNANGGSGTMSDQNFTYDVSQNLTNNSFTWDEAHTFLGWSTDQNASVPTYTNGESVSNLSAENNATVILYAVWRADYYTVDWASTIPSIVSVIANPIGTYPSIQSANRGQFLPGSNVTFTAQFSSSLTQIEENKSYKDNSKYYKFNKWKWANSSDISNNNPVTININRSGTVLADIEQGDLVTYTLGTNYGQAKINNKIATVNPSFASVKLAPGLEYITLEAMVDDSNITFVHWEDENGNVLSSDPTYTFLAGVITSFWAIYRINGKQAYVLVPNDFQAIAQPVYIKNGLITENNTRFMSIKYPEFVDWAEVERITGKKPKKGDFYFMFENEDIF